jgi:periplasmic protein TonB
VGGGQRAEAEPGVFEVVGRKKREGRPSAGGAAVAVLVHAAIVALLFLGYRQTVLLAGEGSRQDRISARDAGGGGGGGGGEQVSYYDLPPPPPPPPPAPPEPDPLVPPVVPPPPPPVAVPPQAAPTPAPPAPAPPAPTPAPAAAGPGTGQGTGPGVGPGTGGGSGGGSGGGNGPGTGAGSGPGAGPGGGSSRITLPEPAFMLLPPTPPRGMPHRDIVLRLAVNERGDVTGVEVLTPTGNRGYDELLKRTARDWKFNPAREIATNRAVAANTDVTVSI